MISTDLGIYCPECAKFYPDLFVTWFSRYEGETDCPEGHHVDVDFSPDPDRDDS